MAYLLPFEKFVVLIQDSTLKQKLSSVKLPDDNFFGEPAWKSGSAVKVNISAKTSESNIKYLEKKFGVASSGNNLDIKGKTGSIRFIKSGKIAIGSTNAMGKALADAGELVTIRSLTTNIKTPFDTGNILFSNDVDAFMRWKQTFQYTKVAVNKIISNTTLSSFDIIHDATDNSQFTICIRSFCKKINKTKDSWNPADIFLIKKANRSAITKELQQILDNYSISDGLVDIFNNKIYSYYKSGLLYPISLKQLNSSTPSIDYNNIPGATSIPAYNIKINKFTVNLSATGKEIGSLTFKNTDTDKIINMQVRGFPHGYTTAQTEITSDGSKTGGRLGKVSTSVMDSVMSNYDDSRINSISFFGNKTNVFSAFTPSVIEETYGWYKTVVAHSLTIDTNPLTLTQYRELINSAKSDFTIAENVCIKLQGLKIMQFFITHEKDISPIMNKIINGAKKISSDNGFHIKIY